MLVIATSLVLLCGWLAWQYSTSTGDDARTYADRTVQRLLFAHDAKYFAANLSPTTARGYPPSQQRGIMTRLTKLGVPVEPVKLAGAVSYSSNPGAQDPEGKFSSDVTYPTAEAHLHLDVARRHGRWEIASGAAFLPFTPTMRAWKERRWDSPLRLSIKSSSITMKSFSAVI